MSDSVLAKPADLVHLVWSILREDGFDAAAHRVIELVAAGVSPQLQADLLPDVAFYPLTPGRDADVATLDARGYRVWDLTAGYDAGFDDVAAHLAALDALVTIDSAPLHLGGALGRPVFAMLDHVSHWAWGAEEAQRWYDSVELFRQPQPARWAPVVERVAARLHALKRI